MQRRLFITRHPFSIKASCFFVEISSNSIRSNTLILNLENKESCLFYKTLDRMVYQRLVIRWLDTMYKINAAVGAGSELLKFELTEAVSVLFCGWKWSLQHSKSC